MMKNFPNCGENVMIGAAIDFTSHYKSCEFSLRHCDKCFQSFSRAVIDQHIQQCNPFRCKCCKIYIQKNQVFSHAKTETHLRKLLKARIRELERKNGI
jgi:hypothetical protein